MTHASLFSGIGGPEISAAMLGWKNIFHCEINPFGRRVLEYWFPNSTSYEDITKTSFKEWRGKVDVLTGGFPCQPFSYAGQRRGADDDRYLWPQMLRCIEECRPTWIVGENVAGITTMVEQGEIFEMGSQDTLFGETDGLCHYRQIQIFTIERVCRDIEGAGYSVQPVIIPACAVGAPHRRDRIFIIAQNTMSSGQLYGQNEKSGNKRNERNACTGDCERICTEKQRIDTANSECLRLQHNLERGGEEEMSGEKGKGGENGFSWEIQCIETACSRESATNTDSALLSRWNSEGSSEGGQRQGTKPFYSEKVEGYGGIAADSDCKWRGEVRNKSKEERTQTGNVLPGCCGGVYDKRAGLNRWDSFPTVSPVHRGNDGLPFDVDHLTIPFAKWRTESLKAYGNAIVPQVMYEIFRAIEQVEKQWPTTSR